MTSAFHLDREGVKLSKDDMAASIGLLAALQALATQQTRFDVAGMTVAAIERALQNGFGPILARVSRDSALSPPTPQGDLVKAADLTARVLTAELFDGLDAILAIAADADCRPALLKGCSTALLYYPEPHLRTMGDIDLFVTKNERPAFEAALRAGGFTEAAGAAASQNYYRDHHHSAPLWHPDLHIRLEIHTALYSPRSPLIADPQFSAKSVETQLTAISFRRHTVRVLTHEAQLVYTSTRWAEYPTPERGGFPIADAALLIGAHAHQINWDLVLGLVGRSWGASALLIMLGYLERWQLASLPPDVLPRLAEADRFTNHILVAALHRFVTAFVMEGRPPGVVLTSRNLRSIWKTMAGPARPSTKLWTVPMNVAFPAGNRGRIDVGLAMRRMMSAGQRVAKR